MGGISLTILFYVLLIGIFVVAAITVYFDIKWTIIIVRKMYKSTCTAQNDEEDISISF